MPDPDAKRLIEDFEGLRGARINFETYWQLLAEHIVPNKADIIVDRMIPGTRKMQKIFDATAIHANGLLASGLHSMLTSPVAPWFGLTIKDPAIVPRENLPRQVRLWVEEIEKLMHAGFNNSNFQSEIHEYYIDLGCFGTPSLFVEEDETEFFRFSARPVQEIFVRENARGFIDTAYRKVQMPARVAIERWGAEKAGGRISTIAEKTPDEMIDILHLIAPRESPTVGKIDRANLPIASIYLDMDGVHKIDTGGFHEMPLITSRWSKVAGEQYGRSPAMTALPDIQMLQAMRKTTIRGAEKVVDPPILAADDGVLLPIRTQAAGLNFARFLADGSDPIRPLRTGGDIQLGLQMEEQIRKAIRDAFFVDQLMLSEGPQMTATEVLQRTEEKQRLLSPVLGRQAAEFLRPLIKRVFGIMSRARILPPPPAALEGRIDVEFISPIAKSQNLVRALGINRMFEATQGLLEARPELLDVVDTDDTFRFMWKMFGLPTELTRSKDQVKEIREAREAAAEQQAQAEQMSQIAESAGKAAPALKLLQGGQGGG